MREASYDTKQRAREATWSVLREEGVARFPFPVEGRIPNFAGADEAARRLLEHPVADGLEALKVNPDSPQKPLRRMALERGIDVYVPTPRLKAGFMLFDPEAIPSDAYSEASSLSNWDRWKQQVDVEDLPQFDLIVAGSVAVTAAGDRAGKGHGYSDLEFGILGEIGHPAVPVVSTVHELQVVEGFPTEGHDVELSYVVTPDRSIDTGVGDQTPGRIRWELLSEQRLDQMPLLRKLKK